MSFQDELLRNMRTKDEVVLAHKKEIQENAMNIAMVIYDDIKRKLISLSNNGEYQVIDNKKVISCMWVFPMFYQQYLIIKDKSTSIPGTPTYLERQLQELLQTPQKQRKNVIKKYRGIDLSSGGKPAQFLPCVEFDIDTNPETEFGCIIEKLQQLAEQDNVSIQLCVKNDYENITYPFCEDINGATADRYKYSIAVKGSTTIPDSYSTDKPIAVIVDDSENLNQNVISFDSMEGHQFERFCAELLLHNGFSNVDVTKGSGDQGIDIIAYKDGIKFGIQCKCYSTDIGNKAIQEAFSGKSFYGCHVAVVLTNRYFTRSAIDLANSNGVLLWDREHLLNMIKNAGIKVNE